jgi:hypothetical protein
MRQSSGHPLPASASPLCDIGLANLVVAVIVKMASPLPPCSPDILVAGSIAIGVVLLLVSLFLPTPLIEVFDLPSYRPQLNANEMANAHLKQATTKLAPVKTKLQLVMAASRHPRRIQRQPESIKIYVQHESVRYAACV